MRLRQTPKKVGHFKPLSINKPYDTGETGIAEAPLFTTLQQDFLGSGDHLGIGSLSMWQPTPFKHFHQEEEPQECQCQGRRGFLGTTLRLLRLQIRRSTHLSTLLCRQETVLLTAILQQGTRLTTHLIKLQHRHPQCLLCLQWHPRRPLSQQRRFPLQRLRP